MHINTLWEYFFYFFLFFFTLRIFEQLNVTYWWSEICQQTSMFWPPDHRLEEIRRVQHTLFRDLKAWYILTHLIWLCVYYHSHPDISGFLPSKDLIWPAKIEWCYQLKNSKVIQVSPMRTCVIKSYYISPPYSTITDKYGSQNWGLFAHV